MTKLADTLETLCSLTGVSGAEDEVRNYILERVLPYADEIQTDAMGNLMVFKKGNVCPERRVMLAAHMDEVGLIITEISEDGYLKFSTVGGIDRRVLLGKRVFVGDARIPGVIGCKAVHLLTAEEKKSVPALKEMFIDIGMAGKAEAEKSVSPGDAVSFEDTIVYFGDGFIKAKAIDDRAGCAVMIELMESTLPCDCWFAFTVQEEVGCRGALAASRSIAPDICLVLEGTTAADIPGVAGAERICRLGNGVVIPFMDNGTIYDRSLYQLLGALADENDIPWQTKTRIAGGTDASAIQRSGTGARVAAVSVPIRNIHTPSCVAKLADCEDQLKLAGLFLEKMSQ